MSVIWKELWYITRITLFFSFPLFFKEKKNKTNQPKKKNKNNCPLLTDGPRLLYFNTLDNEESIPIHYPGTRSLYAPLYLPNELLTTTEPLWDRSYGA